MGKDRKWNQIGPQGSRVCDLKQNSNEVVPQSSLQGNLLVKGATDLKTHHLTLH